MCDFTSTRTQIDWQLWPKEKGGKKLTFELKSILLDAGISKWKLISVENKEHLGSILFQFYKEYMYIELTHLYPFYPKITGVDILQFISYFAFLCKKRIKIVDASNITPTYKIFYNTTYYEYVLKGKKLDVVKNQNKEIEQNFFLKCAKDNFPFEIKALASFNFCKFDIKNCPLTGYQNWFGNFLHRQIMPLCSTLLFTSDHFPGQTVKFFTLTESDVLNLINKPIPETQIDAGCKPRTLEEIENKFEQKPKDSFVKTTIEQAFQICFDQEKMTALNIFKIYFKCVTQLVEYLLKNDCSHYF